MKRLLLLFAILSFACAHAEEQFLGLYMGGSKIGYSSYNSHPEMLGDRRVTRTDSKSKMNLGLLGSAMEQTVDGSTWTDSAGKPLKMLVSMSSAGRSQVIVALFNSKTAEVDIDNAGQKTHESLTLPSGGMVVDDPLELLVGSKVPAGTKKTVFVLDPMTVSFVKTDVILVGPRKIKVKGVTVEASLVQVIDPRLTMDVYVNAKGDLVKVEAPMGIEMLPESREVALSNDKIGYKPSADLAFTTSIRPDKNIDDPANLTGLKLRVSGKDLSRLPSDEYQTVTKSGDAWIIDIHPPKMSVDKPAAIDDVGKEKPDWLKATLDMPADSQKFKDLDATVLKGEKNVLPAALAIKSYVYGIMHPNAGIGVLRDATEVLSSKEGVCRDYAILTATMMRSAGIPARLASGVVNWQGDFYYHAWVEIWDGSNWIGIDSTVPEKQISAAHVKLAEGNVDDAFAFTFLDKVKIDVLDLRRN